MLTLSNLRLGIQSIVSGAQMIMLGEASTVVAGGMEIFPSPTSCVSSRRVETGRSPKVGLHDDQPPGHDLRSLHGTNLR